MSKSKKKTKGTKQGWFDSYLNMKVQIRKTIPKDMLRSFRCNVVSYGLSDLLCNDPEGWLITMNEIKKLKITKKQIKGLIANKKEREANE